MSKRRRAERIPRNREEMKADKQWQRLRELVEAEEQQKEDSRGQIHGVAASAQKRQVATRR